MPWLQSVASPATYRPPASPPDSLCYFANLSYRAQVLHEKIANARLLTIATLTGHVARTYGPYPAAIDNGPARQLGLAESLQKVGQLWAEPVEV